MSRTFVAPTSLDEALKAMAGGARPVAGGTDLVVGARQGKAPLPDGLVAIHLVNELKGIEELEGGGLRLGSLVTHEDLLQDHRVRERWTALADASGIVGSHATRAHGTIGGNVMNGSPAMDTGGPFLCWDATVTLRSSTGSRKVRVADLWTGPGTTVASADELMVAVELPAAAPRTGSCYVRLEYRRQMEIAVVGATAVVTLEDDRVSTARIAITALAPTIRRVPEAEEALVKDGMEAAAAAVSAASTPISDVRASADYRRAMAGVIARRAIVSAMARARGNDVPIPASPALHGAG